MTSALHTSALTSLPLLARGKVRDNYAVGDDRILMVASDRLSAFDVIMGEPIPGKGKLLTQMALYWFDKLGPKGLNICPIHLTGEAPESAVQADEVAQVEGRSMLVKRLKPKVSRRQQDAYDRYLEGRAALTDSELRGLPNVILTPHIGGSTMEAQANIGLEVAEKFARYSDTGTTLSAEIKRPIAGLYIRFDEHRLCRCEGGREEQERE